jgi:methylmalonyl-CoA mutase
VIVGVNRYKPDDDAPIDVLTIDNAAVRDQQAERLKQVRAARDSRRVEGALNALTQAARSGDGNLLALSIEAMRARATVGEVSEALERVFTRHKATALALSGVYGAAYGHDARFAEIRSDVERFAVEEGRRPRMLVVKLGQDGHDRGAKVIATAFADLGFDIDIGPLFQTPDEAAKQAVDNDVHVVGISSQAAGHRTLVPALIENLRSADAGHILVVCGGVIPPQDYPMLYDAGVTAIYGPGTNIPAAAADVLKAIRAGGRLAA